MSEYITIYRRESSAKLPQEYKDEAKVKLSAGITSSGIPLKGISIQEEEKILPSIIGLPPTHVEFASKVNTWYNNLSKDIPKNGIKLNVTVSETTGMPEVPIDYLIYKRALVDKIVAKNKTELLSNQMLRFYISDENLEKKTKLDALEQKEKAQREYFKVKDSVILTDAILSVFAQIEGLKTSKYTSLPDDEKILVLDKFVTSQPSKFLELALDKDLELKAEIYTMVDLQLLTRSGNKFINGTEPLGDNLNETVAYFKSNKNQAEYVKLKAAVDEFSSKSLKPKKK